MNAEASNGSNHTSTAGYGGPTPPHINSPRPPYPAHRQGLFEGFDEDYIALTEGAAPLSVIEALLKHPARIVHEIQEGNPRRIIVALLLILTAAMLTYGLLMATFSGGHQLWLVPLRVIAGTLLSALICLPSLYILTSLSGGKQTPGQIAGLLLQAVTLTSILLAGFAPVAWLFSQSTDTVGFMSFMHLLFWYVGTCFGLSLLSTALQRTNERPIRALKLWSVIFVIVVLQMCTTLRPLVAGFDGFRLQDKKFFLTHWGETIFD